MMEIIGMNENSNYLLAENFNVIFNTNLEYYGGSLSFKQKSLAKLIKVIETFNLCDI